MPTSANSSLLARRPTVKARSASVCLSVSVMDAVKFTLSVSFGELTSLFDALPVSLLDLDILQWGSISFAKKFKTMPYELKPFDVDVETTPYVDEQERSETHDRWTAATSHMPYLIASALAASTPQDVAPLVGPGFQSTSRLAASDITMMLDILATNQAQVLKALACYRDALDKIESVLQENPENLGPQLEYARQNRESIVNWIS